jgi:hypothetical protein
MYVVFIQLEIDSLEDDYYGRRVDVKIPESVNEEDVFTKPSDYEKVVSTLKQFVRDWSQDVCREK